MSAIDLEKPIEEASLFNPAFISVLMNHTTRQYQGRTSAPYIPIPLLYLAVPIILHCSTRSALPKSIAAQMHQWIQEHPDLIMGLPSRAQALMPMIGVAVCVSIRHGVLMENEGGVSAGRLRPKPKGLVFTDEVDECIKRADFMGRWLATQNDPITTLAIWGLRP